MPDVPFSQEAHQMMRTTAMNSVQIMKEIKDGSKKENIKSVYTFHVSNKIWIWEIETGNGDTNKT